MYEIISSTRKVNGISIDTWKREIEDANILAVEAGTNGYHGGDARKGCHTYIRIMDKGGTDIDARIIRDRHGNAAGIEVALSGDSELSTTIEALNFILKVLEEEREDALLE